MTVPGTKLSPKLAFVKFKKTYMICSELC